MPLYRANKNHFHRNLMKEAVSRYRQGCIEFVADKKMFMSCSDHALCPLREGEPCVLQGLSAEITDGLNINLATQGPFLLLAPEEASKILVLIETSLLKYDPQPLPNRMSYYLARAARSDPGNWELIAYFNDSLAVLVAQGWEAGYSPDVLGPILRKISRL